MSKRVLYREYDENGTLIKLECSKCGEIKTVDNFSKNKKGKDGYTIECKLCRKEYKKQYYQENREKILEHQRQYNKNNKEIIAERAKKYQLKNKDKIKIRSHKYYLNNQDKIKIRSHKYYLNNQDKIHKYRNQNRDKLIEKNRQWRINNKDKIQEYRKDYRKENRDKLIELNRQWCINNKDKRRKHEKKYISNKVNKEMKRIYENVTKNLYPNSSIQYGIIYGVHCINSNRWYIGQTKRGFNIRYKGDFFTYKFYGFSEDNPKLQLLQDDIEKYGQESFEIFEVIDVAFSEKELDEKEVYYIDYYKAYDEGYNSTRGNIFKHNKSKRKDVI